jgi:hypothetical protein
MEGVRNEAQGVSKVSNYELNEHKEEIDYQVNGNSF